MSSIWVTVTETLVDLFPFSSRNKSNEGSIRTSTAVVIKGSSSGRSSINPGSSQPLTHRLAGRRAQKQIINFEQERRTETETTKRRRRGFCSNGVCSSCCGCCQWWRCCFGCSWLSRDDDDDPPNQIAVTMRKFNPTNAILLVLLLLGYWLIVPPLVPYILAVMQ